MHPINEYKNQVDLKEEKRHADMALTALDKLKNIYAPQEIKTLKMFIRDDPRLDFYINNLRTVNADRCKKWKDDEYLSKIPRYHTYKDLPDPLVKENISLNRQLLIKDLVVQQEV